MLDGGVKACRVGPPHVSLVLRGTWMCPKPVGIVAGGTDTSFDMWDLCGGHKDAPCREL